MSTTISGARPRFAYTPTARMLHWLTALCVAVLVPVGLAMGRTPEGAFTNALYEIHKSFGIIIFFVMLARIAVRVVNGAPEPDPDLTPLERGLSHAVHMALYALLFFMPIGGYLATAGCCSPVNLFWTVPMPLQIPLSEGTVKAIFKAHEIGGYAIIGLVILHLAGVVNHAMVKRDAVLSRMWPER